MHDTTTRIHLTRTSMQCWKVLFTCHKINPLKLTNTLLLSFNTYSLLCTHPLHHSPHYEFPRIATSSLASLLSRFTTHSPHKFTTLMINNEKLQWTELLEVRYLICPKGCFWTILWIVTDKLCSTIIHLVNYHQNTL